MTENCKDIWYILVHDDSGHGYVIPEEMRGPWYSFLEDPEMPYMDVPEWAERVEQIKFKIWKKR